MRADLVLIGNDVHHPLQEMAAHLTATFCAAAELPVARVVSIQSRKGASSAGETLIPRRFGRAGQLALLLHTLWKAPRSAALLYIGNGNGTLLTALTTLAKLRRQRFVFYPLGAVSLPRTARPGWIWVPHERLVEHYQRETGRSARISVIPPFVNLPGEASVARRWQGGRMLFASVPPHASEFALRRIPQLFEGIRTANELGIAVTLTVLNRYPSLHDSLERLIDTHRGNEFITLHSELIGDIGAFMKSFDMVVAPSGSGPLPQVPLTAVEALTVGIPVLAESALALASDLQRYSAGAVFDNTVSFVEAVRSVRDRYSDFSQGARRLASERYSALQGRNAFLQSCATLLEH